MSLRDRLATAVARAAEVETQLSDPATARDSRLLAELGREHRQLQTVVSLANRLDRAERERAEALELAQSDDPEMASEAHAEEQRLTDEIAQIEIELKPALVPPDPLDDRPAIVEIRAGTGGDEAALFAAELWRMYTRYCEARRWRVEIISLSEATLGGVKEVIFKIIGTGAFGAMRWESGVHRV